MIGAVHIGSVTAQAAALLPKTRSPVGLLVLVPAFRVPKLVNAPLKVKAVALLAVTVPLLVTPPVLEMVPNPEMVPL